MSSVRALSMINRSELGAWRGRALLAGGGLVAHLTAIARTAQHSTAQHSTASTTA
ncbi:MAG TPA: hypothetical protein VIT41_11220 [Microlunatus sp.]